MYSETFQHSNFSQNELHQFGSFESPQREPKSKPNSLKDDEEGVFDSHHKVLGERKDEVLNRTPLNRCKTQESLSKASFLFKSFDKQKSYVTTENCHDKGMCSPSSKNLEFYLNSRN